MEAAAIEKLENLITDSQTETETPNVAPKLFPLDQREIVREIEVVYDDDAKITLYHKIAWPTLEALNDRQRQTPFRAEVIGGGRIKSENDEQVGPNALLWDKFASEVKGYEWDGVEPDQWVKVTDALRAEIPSEHKSEAIVGLFASQFEVERPQSRGFVLGAQTYRVKQTYGPYTIYHVFGRPSDRDRRELARKSLETQAEPGATRSKREIYTNLKPYYETYDKIFDHLEGVTGDDPNISRRKDLVSALWKLGAMDALMGSFEAQRRDSSRN